MGEAYPIISPVRTFPSTEGNPGTSPSKCWRNLSAAGHRAPYLPSAVTDTLGYAAKLNELGVKIIAIPKTMDNDVHNTEYCIGFSTRDHPAPPMPSSASGPPSPRTSGSAFSESSAAMAGFTALYNGPTSPRSAVSSPKYKVNLDKLIRLLIEEKRAKPEQLCAGRAQRGRRVGGLSSARIRRSRRLRPPQEGERRRGRLATKIKRRTGEETMVSDLTYDLALGRPGLRRQARGLDVRPTWPTMPCWTARPA